MAAFQCRSHAVGGSESSASRGWSADLSPMLSCSGACLVIGRADDSQIEGEGSFRSEEGRGYLLLVV